ncbi:MAG: methyltransferase domain-containing protein [Verrucomicrobia bacterium]|nr:methyltransferase domain-containing protein [Verrucomicrobiota bacterium]
MNPHSKKRQVDFQVIARWVNAGDRVLDLGCGRGILLESLMQKQSVYGVGVDIELDKIISCVKRGVSAYHGDVHAVLENFGDASFDRVILSRSVDLLEQPDATLTEALRVGKHVTVGFVNHGFWRNRLSFLSHGRRVENEVYPKKWYESQPTNPFSINEFDSFCAASGIQIMDREYLQGNWRDECRLCPGLMAGYAIYNLTKA